MSYEIIWEERGAIKRFWGMVTSHDMVQSVLDTERDPRFDDMRYVINDFLDITGCSAGASDAEEVATQDCGAAMTNPRIRIAVVTDSPSIIALTNQYANSPVNAYETRIFSTLPEARAWLG